MYFKGRPNTVLNARQIIDIRAKIKPQMQEWVWAMVVDGLEKAMIDKPMNEIKTDFRSSDVILSPNKWQDRNAIANGLERITTFPMANGRYL